MPYDLYGNYYKSRIYAENAEMAQMAAIDADKIKREMRQQQHIADLTLNNLHERIRDLEYRIGILEELLKNNHVTKE